MKSGSALVVMDSGYSAHREQLFIEQLAGHSSRRAWPSARLGQVDAVQKWKLLRPDTPVVIINAAGDFGENATRVAPDNALAIRLAVKHLHDLGHRRITLLTARAGEVADHDRLVYFHSYCEKFGIHPEPFEVALEFDHIRLGVKELLAGKRPPTAIITNSDYAACAVYQAARESQVEVGSGLSVVGHDDLLTSQLLDPPLTTIRWTAVRWSAAIFEQLSATDSLGDYFGAVTLGAADPQNLQRPPLKVPRSANRTDSRSMASCRGRSIRFWSDYPVTGREYLESRRNFCCFLGWRPTNLS